MPFTGANPCGRLASNTAWASAFRSAAETTWAWYSCRKLERQLIGWIILGGFEALFDVFYQLQRGWDQQVSWRQAFLQFLHRGLPQRASQALSQYPAVIRGWRRLFAVAS